MDKRFAGGRTIVWWINDTILQKHCSTALFRLKSFKRKGAFLNLYELIHEFLFDCKVRELSELTCTNYEKQLNKFRHFVRENYNIIDFEELKPVHIKYYISSLQDRGCKPAYINDLLKAVKCMCAYAQREGYSDEILTKRVRNVKQPKVLIHTFNTKEISRMLKYFNGNDYVSVRNKMILMVFFDTGIRLSELTNMKLDQIQDSYFVIYGKGRKERVVPKNPAVGKFMYKYLSAREKYFMSRNCEDDYVFLSKNGKRLNAEAVAKFMKEAAEAVGVNPKVRVSPHTCRHTFAHQQLKNGLDLYSLSRLLGHESVTVTQRYLESIEDTQILTSARKTSVIANL